MNLEAIEDCVLFRTVALHGLNDLTRLIAYQNRDIITLISESQSVRLVPQHDSVLVVDGV